MVEAVQQRCTELVYPDDGEFGIGLNVCGPDHRAPGCEPEKLVQQCRLAGSSLASGSQCPAPAVAAGLTG